jgi:hypothetical protein
MQEKDLTTIQNIFSEELIQQNSNAEGPSLMQSSHYQRFEVIIGRFLHFDWKINFKHY